MWAMDLDREKILLLEEDSHLLSEVPQSESHMLRKLPQEKSMLMHLEQDPLSEMQVSCQLNIEAMGYLVKIKWQEC